MKTEKEKIGFSNPLVQKIGCFGCLTYIILFFTAGYLVTSFGFNTLWVVPFMILFVFIWAIIFMWALRK